MGTILFFDDWPLCFVENVRRVMGKPKWIPEATLEDDLTEGTWNFPFVWHDRQAGQWKAVYCAALESGPRRPEGIYPRSQALMYAQSPDGVAWSRPDVSGHTQHIERRERPNMVFAKHTHMDGAPIFMDERDPDPSRRLKYLFTEAGRQGMAASPDGIRWHEVPGVLVGDYALDAPITCYYNHLRQSYCISRRLHLGDRRIALFETRDWKTYSVPEVVIHPDAEDPPLLQFYGMPVYRYESLYVGLLWRLHCHPTRELRHKLTGPLDCALAYSFDGWHYVRATHEAFIPVNERGEHGGGCIYCGTMLVDDRPQIRFYSGGSKAEHFVDQNITDAALMLHTLRLDGFFRLESYSTLGRIMTRSVVFSGPNMKLNVRCPHGSVRVGLRGNNGEVVEGFTLDDCVPFSGDDLFLQPSWRSGKTLSALCDGKRYHIEVELNCAEIYAIRGDLQMEYGALPDGREVPYRYKV